MGVPKGTACLSSAAECSDSKCLWSASMGRNSTFKKRRHSYKGALGVELKVRGIGTNFVVYYSCTSTCFMHRTNLLKRIAHARRGFL